MGNTATAATLQMELDIFSVPAPKGSEFWTRCASDDTASGRTLTAIRGQDLGVRIFLDHEDGKWFGSWEIGTADYAESGGGRHGRKGQPDREGALLVAGDGIDRAANRLQLTKRARREITRWLLSQGAL